MLIAVLAGGAYATTVAIYPSVSNDFAAIRQVTTKYHDVNAVLADGFIRTPACVEESGLGGMGIHFINPARIMDPAINLSSSSCPGVIRKAVRWPAVLLQGGL